MRVSLTAPPVEGEANKSLVRFLAKILGVSPSSIAIERGKTSRLKTVSVEDLAQDELKNRLEAALAKEKA